MIVLGEKVSCGVWSEYSQEREQGEYWVYLSKGGERVEVVAGPFGFQEFAKAKEALEKCRAELAKQ